MGGQILSTDLQSEMTSEQEKVYMECYRRQAKPSQSVHLTSLTQCFFVRVSTQYKVLKSFQESETFFENRITECRVE